MTARRLAVFSLSSSPEELAIVQPEHMSSTVAAFFKVSSHIPEAMIST